MHLTNGVLVLFSLPFEGMMVLPAPEHIASQSTFRYTQLLFDPQPCCVH